MSRKILFARLTLGTITFALASGIFVVQSISGTLPRGSYSFLHSGEFEQVAQSEAVLQMGDSNDGNLQFLDRYNLKCEYDKELEAVRAELLPQGFVEQKPDPASPNQTVFLKDNPRPGCIQDSVTVASGKFFPANQHLHPPVGRFLVTEPWCAISYKGILAKPGFGAPSTFVKSLFLPTLATTDNYYRVASAPKSEAEALTNLAAVQARK